ncbi:MAG: AAA family ATPase [Gaiellaceae bacterium]
MPGCERCGQDNPPEARFCLACGARLAAGGEAHEERKVVTVLFADLVGFTSRVEKLDPEDVRALLGPYYARLRGELERHGGTVEKFIGDAVMALFGAPVAHEDDPERAVRAALAIRDAIDELNHDAALDLRVRIGVNTGDALIALRARPGEGEGMASGDVVNAAARLQVAAPVNGILVGDPTWRATRQVIRYEKAEPVLAKGRSEPIPAWEALEAVARLGVDLPGRDGAELVGRTREVLLLRETLARVRLEREPQLLTIVGVPGIGKSRLIAELSQIAEEDPELIRWRQGRSLPYGQGVAFWALAEMVKGEAGVLESDPPSVAERKLEATVTDVVHERPEAVWIAGQLRPLLGLGSEPREADRRAEAFAAWRRYLEALAEARPTVLVFEDIQWADDGMLDFVDHLVDWARGVPLLVVCSTRPELLSRRPGWGGGKANAGAISLSPLSDEESARLLQALLERTPLPAELQQTLLERAGGNPLYAEQYARALAERGALEELPETIQGIVAARIDALAPPEKALLQDAAVVGKLFWTGALAKIGDAQRWTIEELLHELERKEFVRRERRSAVASESQYAFRHILVRDVAYGQIPRRARAEKHTRAAEWIQSLGRSVDHAEMLAHHFQAALEFARASGQPTALLEEQARAALEEAGRRAVALSTPAAAGAFFSAAGELWPEGSRERAMLERQRFVAVAQMFGPEIPEQGFGLRDRLLEMGELEAAAEIETILARWAWHEGRPPEALERLESALALLRDRPQSRERALVLSERVRMLVLAAATDPVAIAAADEAMAAARELGRDDLFAHALNSRGIARIYAGEAEGLEDLHEARTIKERLGGGDGLLRALINLGSLSAVLGDVRAARRHYEDGEALAQKLGSVRGLRWLQPELAQLDYWEGAWESARERIDDYMTWVAQGNEHYLEGEARIFRGLMSAASGAGDAAMADVRRAVEQARAAGDPQAVVPALAIAARVAAELGLDEEASAYCDEAIAQGPQIMADWVAPAMVALGRQEELLDFVSRIRPRTCWAEAAEKLARGEAAEAAEIYEQAGDLVDAADARLVAAEAELAAGHGAAAQAQLEAALSFSAGVGASARVARAEAMLTPSA